MNTTTVAEYLREWLEIIGSSKEGMKHSDMLKQFYANHPEIADKDKETVRVSVGHNRTNCSRAGWVHFLEQGSWNTGLWYLTEEGRKALEKYPDPLAFMKAAASQRKLIESNQEQMSRSQKKLTEQFTNNLGKQPYRAWDEIQKSVDGKTSDQSKGFDVIGVNWKNDLPDNLKSVAINVLPNKGSPAVAVTIEYKNSD